MKISVAMAVYEGKRYIAQQIVSIINQSVKPDEVVIVDDCSRNPCKDIIDTLFCDSGISLRYYVHSMNVGYCQTFIDAVSKTSGDVVFLSDQDDIWDSRKIEIMSDILYRNEQVKCLSCLNIVVDKNLKTIQKERKKRPLHDIYMITMDDLLSQRMLRPGMTLGFRDSIRRDLLSIDSRKFTQHDRLIEFLACKNQNFYLINNYLNLYRIHDSNTSGLNYTLKLRTGRMGRYRKAVEECRYLSLLMEKIEVSEGVKVKIEKHLAAYDRRRELLIGGSLARYLISIKEFLPYTSTPKIVLADIISFICM